VTMPFSLKVVDWPEIDRQRWCQARTGLSFLSGARPAAQWSSRRCRIVEQAYGQWLVFLLRTGGLDPTAAPAARVTPDRLHRFVATLRDRVAPWSIAMMVQALRRMLVALDPEHSEPFPAKLVSNLKRLATPSRDKRGHMVAPSDLFALGASLLAQAEREPDRYHSATMARDGVMIALLACAPIRIANLTQIEIGRHLRFDRDRYLLVFSEEETKTRQRIEAELPPEMTPMVEGYLRQFRRLLLTRGDGQRSGAFWIDCWGKPMEEHSIRAQIEKRTRDAFGRHVWPHLFRAIAATGFVDEAPDEIRLLHDLLGHTDDQTSYRYYVLADGMRAHHAVQHVMLAGRAEALRRRQARKAEGSP
jgi:integrase/recombinase XerD